MPQVEGIHIDKFADVGVILEKNYTLKLMYSLLNSDPQSKNLSMKVNANWGQEIIHFDYNNCSVVALSAQGAPFIANAVERLRRTQVRSIISIGTAGSANSKIKDGTNVLPIAAVKDEDVSEGYLSLGVPSLANLKLVEDLTSSLQGLNVETLSGLIYTSNRRYKEDGDALRSLNTHAGVVAVDMETSALFTTAMYYSIPAAAIKIITDCAVSDEDDSFQGVFKEKEVDYETWIRPFIEKAFQGVLHYIRSLNDND